MGVGGYFSRGGGVLVLWAGVVSFSNIRIITNVYMSYQVTSEPSDIIVQGGLLVSLPNRAAKTEDILVQGGLLACKYCVPRLFRSVKYKRIHVTSRANFTDELLKWGGVLLFNEAY